MTDRTDDVVSRSRWKSKKGVKIRRVEPQLAPTWRRVPEDDARASDSRSVGPGKGAREELMRERIGVTIESIVDEELEAARRFGIDPRTVAKMPTFIAAR